MSLLDRFLRRDLHSLAAPYALDALEPDERRRFERHLSGCGRCTAEVRALTEDAVRLAWSTAAPAPAALRDRVLTAVRTTAQEAPRQAALRARAPLQPSRARAPASVPFSPRSPPPRPPRPSSSRPCSPYRRHRPRTSSIRSAPRHVRSPTFSRRPTHARPVNGTHRDTESEWWPPHRSGAPS